MNIILKAHGFLPQKKKRKKGKKKKKEKNFSMYINR